MLLQRESAHDVWDEIQPLLTKHWREIAHYEDIELDPKREVYLHLEDRGVLRVFTMRHGERLVGYAVFIADMHLHYASSYQATQDVLFLLPEYRSVGNGTQLIAFCDAELAAEGVQAVYQHVKRAHDFGPLLRHLGYEPIETLYARRLDHAAGFIPRATPSPFIEG